MRIHQQLSLTMLLVSGLLTSLAVLLLWFQLHQVETELYQRNQIWLQQSYVAQFCRHSEQDLLLLIQTLKLQTPDDIHAQAIQPWAKANSQISWYSFVDQHGKQVATYLNQQRNTQQENNLKTQQIKIILTANDKPLGTLHIEIVFPDALHNQTKFHDTSESFYRALHTSLPLIVILFLAGGVFSWLLNRWLMRPLRLLPRYTQQVLAGNFNIRVAYRGNDEITQMMQALRQIEQALWGEKKKQPASTEAPPPLAPPPLPHEVLPPEKILKLRGLFTQLLNAAELLAKTDLNEEQHYFAITVYHHATELWRELAPWLNTKQQTSDPDCVTPGSAFIPRDLIEELIEQQLPNAQRKQIQLVSSIAPQVPTTLSGDVAFLRQILSNLLQCLVTHTHCGEIVVKILPAELQQNANILAVFELSQRGKWLNEQQRMILISALSGKIKTASPPEGNPLAITLTATRRMVHNLEGELEVISEDKKLTIRFSALVYIPLPSVQTFNALPTSPIWHPAKESAQHSEKRIAVMEKNRINMAITLNMLKIMGYMVDGADSVEQLTSLLHENQYALLLLDCTDSEAQAIEIIKEIRSKKHQNQHQKHLPIIGLVSSILASQQEEWNLREYVDGYVQKPFKLFQLEKVLNQVAGLHREIALR